MNEHAPSDFPEWRPAHALAEGYPPRPHPPAGGIETGLEVRVVAIGNFDGAHRGHASVAATARALAEELAEARGGARRTQAESQPQNLGQASPEGSPQVGSPRVGATRVLRELQVLALTFAPHPRHFFQPDRPHFQLLAPAARAHHLRRIGFDGMVVLPFTAEFAAMSPETFVEEVLVRRLAIDGVVVGEDFHFGKARAGTPGMLVREGARHGFAVRLVPPCRAEDGTIISSSTIRKALGAGEITRANALLGYVYSVSGVVIHGEKRGRDLGYPTANMQLDASCGLAHGIYAVRVRVEGKTHAGVASFGRRPHFDNGAPLLETHVFDFSGDLYGHEIEVFFEAYLRGEAKFDSLDALIAQMDADSASARQLLHPKPR